ncbi:hypothetical protein POM88_029096 [Heracleum sosnowskyi]|uniref:Uncharacterized protein n=1 Tax=Heracleum sosnowskyi TaxID=360622 RepID=A0AAD8MI71_9APIA|nr:hypothetical protein POM88_029096 [Heracleum sosnowskyi]
MIKIFNEKAGGRKRNFTKLEIFSNPSTKRAVKKSAQSSPWVPAKKHFVYSAGIQGAFPADRLSQKIISSTVLLDFFSGTCHSFSLEVFHLGVSYIIQDFATYYCAVCASSSPAKLGGGV